MRILIVDDEIDILGSYKAFFEGKERDVKEKRTEIRMVLQNLI